MRGLVRHLSVAVLGLLVLGLPAPAAQTVQGDTTSRFTVIVQGVRIGTEVVDVTRTASTIRITGFGQLAPPFDLTTNKFEMTYTADWQPQQLVIEGVLRGQSIALGTTFGLTTATSDIVQGEKRGSVTHQISPRTSVVPQNSFAAYEAVAARLARLQPGTAFPIYIAPEVEVMATVERVSPRRVVSPAGATDLRQFDLALATQGGATRIQVWIDERGRLARVSMQGNAVLAIREDLATVMAREETVRNPGDEDVFIGASGFNLGATITRPAGVTGRAPVVILTGSSGRTDRDERLYGIPIFGQIAGRLAEAGYFVVRYDKRGIGQSGGRIEHAGLPEYAEDVARIVAWLRKRSDVDADRISVVAHGDGGAVALAAAAREKRIKAVALLAGPGATGKEIALAQQQYSLARSDESEEDKRAKLALQLRVIDATITGKGWEAIPPAVRRQADSRWFRDWLVFDPAQAIRRLEQPILIVHGALDKQMPPAYADRLEQLSLARNKRPPTHTRKVVVPGVNHLLVPATTGEIDEYESLGSQSVSPEVTSAIIDWLRTAVPPRR